MCSRQALGRGLEALIPQKKVTKDADAVEVKLDLVRPNPFQPRKRFDAEALQELADSIRKHGVLEPVVLRRVGDEFQIVVGERRCRAARLVGLDLIPAVVRSYSDRSMMEIALIENLQREDLDPIEEAQGYQRLMEEFHMTQEEVAQSVGKKRATVANAVRLLVLDDSIQQLVSEGRISVGHAKLLLSVDSQRERLRLARKIVEDQLSVRSVEKMIRQHRSVPRGTKSVRADAALRSLQDELQNVLGTKVNIDYKKGRGKILIE